MKSWEIADQDDGIPDPTDLMKRFEIEYLDIKKTMDEEEKPYTLYNLYDLDDTKFKFYEVSNTKGWKMLEVLYNFSASVDDFTDINFLTAERIMRYNDRVLNDKENNFFENIGYVGVFISSIKMLNKDSLLVPRENKIINTWEYLPTRFFDLNLVLK